MKYYKPQLYRLFPSNISDAFCGAGNNAGAAAGGRCVPGAAAGTECNNGTGFEILDIQKK